MSYLKKKNNNIRVAISATPCSENEAIDLSDKYDNRTDDRNSGENLIHKSSGHVIDHDQTDDDSKSDPTNNKDQGKSGKKRNPKCARCSNHEPEPVPVKGHKRKCPYKECVCTLCDLTVDRRVLMAKTIREKRKQKEDLADKTYVYGKPVFKKHRSDECSSETDRESGYSTEDNNEKSKLMDRDSDDEFKKHLEGMFPIIWKKLAEQFSYSDIGQTLLLMNLMDNRTSILKKKLTTDTIIKQIIEVLKEKNSMITVSAPIVPIPITPLTPTTLSTPFLSPPPSISSTESADSPNGMDPNLLTKSYHFLPPYFHPLWPYGAHKLHLPPPVLNHLSL